MIAKLAEDLTPEDVVRINWSPANGTSVSRHSFNIEAIACRKLHQQGFVVIDLDLLPADAETQEYFPEGYHTVRRWDDTVWVEG